MVIITLIIDAVLIFISFAGIALGIWWVLDGLGIIKSAQSNN